MVHLMDMDATNGRELWRRRYFSPIPIDLEIEGLAAVGQIGKTKRKRRAHQQPNL